MISTVEYRIGTYTGRVEVTDVDPDDDSDHVCARARRILERRSPGLPFGAETWIETERREESDR
jgi:hypothetical protein